MRRIELGTGVTLNVALAGDPASPVIILLHGFPESHRTWREVAPRLQDKFFVVMPDLRGFAGSDLPQDVGDYKTDALVDDILISGPRTTGTAAPNESGFASAPFLMVTGSETKLWAFSAAS